MQTTYVLFFMSTCGLFYLIRALLLGLDGQRAERRPRGASPEEPLHPAALRGRAGARR